MPLYINAPDGRDGNGRHGAKLCEMCVALGHVIGAMGASEITARNAPNVYARLKLYTALHGAPVSGAEITPHTVADHIGLRTNWGITETDRKWSARMCLEHLQRNVDAYDRATREPRDIGGEMLREGDRVTDHATMRETGTVVGVTTDGRPVIRWDIGPSGPCAPDTLRRIMTGDGHPLSAPHTAGRATPTDGALDAPTDTGTAHGDAPTDTPSAHVARRLQGTDIGRA